MSLLNDLAFADFDGEVAATRRVLARLPDDQFGWKPHEKSKPLGELATHCVELMAWQVQVLTGPDIDFATSKLARVDAKTSEALVKAFDAGVEAVRGALASVDASRLGEDWTLRFGDRVVFTRPRAVVFRSFGLSHIAHHRAQLTVYLRLLGVPVPPVYGPSADEQ
jgi:uncharacterized damage-inducible protein DinB